MRVLLTAEEVRAAGDFSKPIVLVRGTRFTSGSTTSSESSPRFSIAAS